MIAQSTVNGGDTAWVLVCAALVLFMTPGLAFFYAGMVRGRNTLVMLQQNIIPIGVVSLTWVVAGYTLAFGDEGVRGVVGNLSAFGLRDLDLPAVAGVRTVAPGVTIPALAFAAYQMMFAVITPALATGAVADRMKFAGWAVFLAVWSLIVYPPITRWLWNSSGWLAERGAQDWAGGMVVHASAGAAALALLVVVGRRRAWPGGGPLPHSLPLVIVGAGILWFGWFGFNAGDGLQADGVAAQALVNTHVAAATGMVIWLLLERARDGHPSVLGAVTGAVAGLATITPCAGYVNTLSAVAIGALAGLVCHLALKAKTYFKFDDALDVIAVHFVGGLLGSLLVGLFGEQAINAAGRDGLFFGGGAGLLGEQALALVAVVAYSFAVTWLIAAAIEKTIGLRVAPEDEDSLDQVQQGMDAYHFSRMSSFTGRPDREPEVHEPEVHEPEVHEPEVHEPEVHEPEVHEPEVHEPVQHAQPGTRLVSVVVDVDAIRAPELKRALLASGASTIVTTEAQLVTRRPEEQIVRGERRKVEAPYRLRVDALVPEPAVDSVLAAFDRFASGHEDGFVQAAEATASRR